MKGPKKIRTNRNRTNRGQCYTVTVPKGPKNRTIPKIRTIARPILHCNGSFNIIRCHYEVEKGCSGFF